MPTSAACSFYACSPAAGIPLRPTERKLVSSVRTKASLDELVDRPEQDGKPLLRNARHAGEIWALGVMGSWGQTWEAVQEFPLEIHKSLPSNGLRISSLIKVVSLLARTYGKKRRILGQPPSARSASTLAVSRPAQRSLALRPVGSLHRQSDTSVSKAPTVSLPPPPPR